MGGLFSFLEQKSASEAVKAWYFTYFSGHWGRAVAPPSLRYSLQTGIFLQQLFCTYTYIHSTPALAVSKYEYLYIRLLLLFIKSGFEKTQARSTENRYYKRQSWIKRAISSTWFLKVFCKKLEFVATRLLLCQNFLYSSRNWQHKHCWCGFRFVVIL